MIPADRARVVELLADPSLSCRAIARETGYSDWTIRKIARELDGDPRPMRQRRSYSDEAPAGEVSPVPGWVVFGSIAALFAFAIWTSSRWGLPPE